MSLNPKIAGLLGFAAKSGKLLLGTYSVEQSIRQKRAKLVLAAEDLNPKRLKILGQWCGDMEIPFLVVGMKKEYGEMLRKPPLGLLALTEDSLVKGIIMATEETTKM